MITGAIFDFDGTLFDTMQYWDDFNIAYLKKYNITAPNNLNDILISMTNKEAAEYFHKEFSIPLTPKQIQQEIEEEIVDAYANEFLPKQGVIKVLAYLQSKHIPICIATANDETLIQKALDRCGLTHYFQAVLSCPMYNTTKKEDKIFIEASKIMHSKKSQQLYLKMHIILYLQQVKVVFLL